MWVIFATFLSPQAHNQRNMELALEDLQDLENHEPLPDEANRKATPVVPARSGYSNSKRKEDQSTQPSGTRF
jgi:hypothetical protein